MSIIAMNNHPHPARRNHGASLLEVLIALFVLSTGLMGLAGLNTQALKSKLESYQRLEALLLVDQIAHNGGMNPDCQANGLIPDTCLQAALHNTELTGVHACSTVQSDQSIIISVSWLGLFDHAVPNNPCGLGLYEHDSRRRVVSTLINTG